MKTQVGALFKEKALGGAFSAHCETLYGLVDSSSCPAHPLHNKPCEGKKRKCWCGRLSSLCAGLRAILIDLSFRWFSLLGPGRAGGWLAAEGKLNHVAQYFDYSFAGSQPSPGQASPGQPRPAHPRPAQPSPGHTQDKTDYFSSITRHSLSQAVIWLILQIFLQFFISFLHILANKLWL